MDEEYCDPVTGECRPNSLSTNAGEVGMESGKELIYIGDPMCSWCWGISNHLKKLKEHFNRIKFKIIVGGLRPGGGDKWDANMKGFLRHHWDEVQKRSGQPFGYKLFDLEHFNYDTEPPCRAVVAGRKWVGNNELAFFEAISRKFYVENEDPSQVEFYRSICNEFSIMFEDFIEQFNSEKVRKITIDEFQMNRQWGVAGFPTVLFLNNEELFKINYGYREFSGMKEAIDGIIAGELKN